MHQNLIKIKYKNFLESNFYFPSDQNKASEILSKVSNENLDSIFEKSSKILNKIILDSNKIEVLKIFSHSNFEKIHSLAACEKIFDDFFLDNEKIEFLKKLDKIDAAKTYAVSLSKDHLKNFSSQNEKIKFLDSIIFAKTIEKAFDLIGINDYSLNLPFHEIYYDDSLYYTGISYYEKIYPSNSNYRSIYPEIKKENPIIHNHYYVNENQASQNSQIIPEEETSALGTLEWLALAATGIAAYFGFNYLTSDPKTNDSNNIFESKDKSYTPLFPSLNETNFDNFSSTYSSIYSFPQIKPSAPSIYDDLPPSYESLFPKII